MENVTINDKNSIMKAVVAFVKQYPGIQINQAVYHVLYEKYPESVAKLTNTHVDCYDHKSKISAFIEALEKLEAR